MTTRGHAAIVTGGGRGLGRAMALGLARAGVGVVVTASRQRDQVDALAAEMPERIHAVLADVRLEADCEAVAREAESRFGPVDILVNNAGRGMRFVSERFLTEPTRFWEADPSVWRMIIDTNVNGPFLMARAVVAGMIDRGWGRIINISMNHETMRRRGFSPYGPSKAALESETIIWAQDLAGTGVTVNALLPGGATLTGMIPDGVPPEVRQQLIRPEVMVPPLLWLVSDAADHITGRRFNASRWDGRLEPEQAAARASESAGWAVQ